MEKGKCPGHGLTADLDHLHAEVQCRPALDRRGPVGDPGGTGHTINPWRYDRLVGRIRSDEVTGDVAGSGRLLPDTHRSGGVGRVGTASVDIEFLFRLAPWMVLPLGGVLLYAIFGVLDALLPTSF